MANSRNEIPSIVNPKHLQANGKLFSEEEILQIKAIIDSSKGGDENLYIPRTKRGNFSVTYIEGQLYGIYLGKKHNKHIGAGSFGVVKYLQNLETGEWLALKVLKKKDATLMKEVEINQMVGLGKTTAYEREGKNGKMKFEFVMSLAPGKDLYDAFDERFSPDAKTIPLADRMKAAIQLVAEVQKIHQLGILHCDLKPDNLFYDSKTNKLTILDYGLAQKLNGKTQIQTGYCGTPDYIPPEIRLGRDKNTYTVKSDTYAVGVILASVLGFSLQANQDNLLLNFAFHNASYSPIDTTSITNPEKKDLARLVNAMIDNDPAKRPELAVALAELQRIQNHPKPDYVIALINAIESKDESALKIALILINANKMNRRFDINENIDMRGNLLHIAALAGNDAAIDLLVANDADINARNSAGNTALHLAAADKSDGGVRVIKVLRKNDIDVDATNHVGDTALHVAARCSNLAAVSQIIKELPDCKIQNNQGMTAAGVARAILVKSDEDKTIAKLVDPHGFSTRMDVGLFKSVSTAMVQQSLADASKNTKEALTRQLHDAIKNGDYHKVDALLEKGADVNLQIDGKVALNFATDPYDPYFIKLLIINRADINKPDHNGEILLHHAANHKDRDLLEFLLLFDDLDVNAVNANGETAAHIAAIRNDHDFVIQLLDCKFVDVDIMTRLDNEGMSPQDYFEAHDIEEPVKPYVQTSEHPVTADMRIHVADMPANVESPEKLNTEVEIDATTRRPGF